jgi:dsDNA-specific endonuclease/ATPase MutS2
MPHSCINVPYRCQPNRGSINILIEKRENYIMNFNNTSQQVRQIEQTLRELEQQTRQSNTMYQQLLQQEQQNAIRLEELSQREHNAAQIIQTALQGHQQAMQQFQQISQLVQQIDHSNQTQSFGGSSNFNQPSIGQVPFQSQTGHNQFGVGQHNFSSTSVGRGQQGFQPMN